MFSSLFRFATWLLRKAGVALLIAGLGVLAYATWLYLHDETSLDTRRSQSLEALSQRRASLVAVRVDVEHRIEALRGELRSEDERAARAGRIIETLRPLQSRWERWFGDAAQQRANEAQIEHLRGIQEEANQKKLQVQRVLNQTAWQRERVENQLQPLDQEITEAQKPPSPVVHYLTTAWHRARPWLTFGILLYVFGPWLVRLFLYFGVAPFVVRGKAICFAPELQQLPQVSAGEGSIDAALWPGEILVVRSKYLAEANTGVNRRTRPLLDWSLPLTSFVSGLFSVVELHNRHVGTEHRVLLARSDFPKAVFAVAQISEGSSLILRPKFLAGVIHQAAQPLVIRSRWRLFNRQSWVTFQFRYMEFAGPCRLIITARSGLHIEQLVPREVGGRPLRRFSPLAAIGFTPNLDFALVRTERFWRYLSGRDPLIEMSFTGPGLVLARDQGSSVTGRFGRFWSLRWNRLLRVIGA